MPAVSPYGDFEGFLGREWEAATDRCLLGAVRDLRQLFESRAKFFFRSVRKEVYEFLHLINSEERPLHLMDLFASTFTHLQDVLSRDLAPYFDSFLQIAISHAELRKSDPVVWAHSQTHAMIADFLDPRSGYRKFSTVREWIKDYCNAPTVLDETPFSSDQEFERSMFRLDWRAPRWVQLYVSRRPYSGTREYLMREVITQQETEEVLEMLAQQFWTRIKGHLVHRAQMARIELVKQGRPAKPLDPAHSSSLKRKASKPMTDFVDLAGRLMHEARAKHGSRFSDETWIEICSQLDARQFKPLSHLEGTSKRELGKWNQKHPNRPIRTFAEGMKPPAVGAKFLRRAIQRTLYRAQKKWEKSLSELVPADFADRNLRSPGNDRP